MKVYYILDLTTFKFWGGAKDRVSYLRYDELEALTEIFEDIFEEISETEINDIFWFEEDWIAEMLGYEDFEELMLKRKLETIKLTREQYSHKD